MAMGQTFYLYTYCKEITVRFDTYNGNFVFP